MNVGARTSHAKQSLDRSRDSDRRQLGTYNSTPHTAKAKLTPHDPCCALEPTPPGGTTPSQVHPRTWEAVVRQWTEHWTESQKSWLVLGSSTYYMTFSRPLDFSERHL